MLNKKTLKTALKRSLKKHESFSFISLSSYCKEKQAYKVFSNSKPVTFTFDLHSRITSSQIIEFHTVVSGENVQ